MSNRAGASAPDEITRRLESCYTGVIHDVMQAMGLRDFTLPHDIRPILPERTLVGPVFTLSGHLVPDADVHECLLAWTGFLSKATPGHVVVCQPKDGELAHMGELSAETLQRRGIRGYVVDGGCRDVEIILKIGFPVYCRYFTPRDIAGAWLPDGFDQPIRIGPVEITPGDYLCADRDGVCILPRAKAAEIVAEAETAAGTESEVRKAILAGADPQDAYLDYGKF